MQAESSLPLKRKGVHPTKPFDVAKHLSTRTDTEYPSKDSKENPINKMNTSSIINKECAPFISELISKTPTEINNPINYPHSAVGLVISNQER